VGYRHLSAHPRKVSPYIIALPSVTCVVVHAAAVPCEAALCIAFVSSSLSVRLSSYNSSMESGRISDLVDYLMHV